MGIDWRALFVPETSLATIVIRGSIMYLALFGVLRIVVRRQIGALSVTDLLLIVLIADAAQNAMAGDSKSVPEGLVLCGTLVAWSYLLDWLAFRVTFLRRWLDPPPLTLIRNGRVQQRHLRQELITEEELVSRLRQEGIENVRDVRLAFLEPDGHISVIRAAQPTRAADASR